MWGVLWVAFCLPAFTLPAGVLVQLESARPDKGAATRAWMRKAGARHVRSFPNIGWEFWEAPPALSDSAFAESLSKYPGVKHACLPTRIKLFSTFPDDPDFSDGQWALYSPNMPDYDIDAPEAWDVTTGSAQLIVAVIDTGIDPTHADLALNIWHNPDEIPDNGKDDDGNGFVDDDMGWDFANNINLPYDNLGHGTHVSGIIGAVGNNGIGICGVNWRTAILTLKVFEQSETTDDVIVAAFDYVLGMKRNVAVINASWGGTTFSLPIYDAIAACGRRGILVCVAAGNVKISTADHPIYPGACDLPNIITVAGSNMYGYKYDSTSFGPLVHVCAPGDNILSTLPAPFLYWRLSGTSMAAPHVSGAALLLLSVQPSLTPEAVRNRIMGSSKPIPTLQDISLSQGLINLPALFTVDSEAPAAITDLSVTGAGITTATLEFTLPHDEPPDEPVSIVELRCAAFSITAQNWWETRRIPALILRGIPGERRTVSVAGLFPDTLYHFAARSIDEGGNVSALSNDATTRTVSARTVYYEDFENGATGWEIGEMWDIATSPSLAAGGVHFLFHPEANPPYPTPDVATSPWLDLTTSHAPYLTFSHLYEYYGFQRLTNAGIVEVLSEAEEEWHEVARFEMYYSPWKRETISLGAWIGQRIRIRFRFFHVFSPTEELSETGWLIDEFRILEAGESSAPAMGIIAY